MATTAPRAALIAGAAAASLMLGAGLWFSFGEGDGLEACRDGGGVIGADIGGPFTLTDETGARVTAEQAIDRLTLLYFGYTHCPDFCPTDAATMAAAADMLAERGVEVNTVFVTIDPARDTPEALAAFTDAMHPDMLGLTGSDEDIAAAARAWRVYYAKAGDDPDYYLMDHSTFTYLAHPERGLLDFFRHGDAPEALAERTACFADALR